MTAHLGSILIVDDERAIVNVLERSLAARGYAVRIACGGIEALAALAELEPDVLLLDINLPDLTGWEVLRRLSPAERERVPVIVFSASPLSPSRVEEFHPAGVLLKPFPMDALIRLVDEVTGAQREELEQSDV
jgi:two-component system, OmpR family, response regulator